MTDFIESILIILVIYNRPLEECESFQSLKEMQSKEVRMNVFIYDNSPHPQNIIEPPGMRITYRHDPANSGVSKAYNTGVAHAQQHKQSWALLLDQDTILPRTIIEMYWQAIQKNPEVNLFVPVLELSNGKIFSPCRYVFKRGRYLNTIEEGLHSLNKLSPVNSGMMINVDAFLESGGYNEKVKLDFSDFQFIERFRKKHPFFYVINSKCVQDFSDNDLYDTQVVRFKYYCDGARAFEKNSAWERMQYAIIVLARALRLSMRYKTLVFFSTAYITFFKPSASGTK